MRYLITGKNGQLARAFISRLKEKSADFIAPEKQALDITDVNHINNIFESYKPDAVINCAAYNLVDKAEEEYDRAFAVNAAGPKFLASAAKKNNAVLVHFSSDYVFDGTKTGGLYTEDDMPNPISRYGTSKMLGEKYVREETGRHLIFRTSWVFGEGRRNFICKLIEWSKKNDFLQVSDDEVSIPTYTYTIADIALKSLEKGLSGLFHITSSGFCSRYEWAEFTIKKLGINKAVKPVSKDIFKLPAKRPAFSAMSNARVSEALGVSIPPWEHEVEIFLREKLSI